MKNAAQKTIVPLEKQNNVHAPLIPPSVSGPFGSVTILGVRVDCISPGETLAEIDRYVAARTPHHIVTADASMVVTARHDPALREIIARADLVTPDGFGILWASRQMRTPVPHKVSGVDLVGELCRLSPAKGYRLFFSGRDRVSPRRLPRRCGLYIRAHRSWARATASSRPRRSRKS